MYKNILLKSQTQPSKIIFFSYIHHHSPHNMFQTADVFFFIVIWDALETLEWVAFFHGKNRTGLNFSKHDP